MIKKKTPEGKGRAPGAASRLMRLRKWPLVYVCSPYSGDVEANVENARKYCAYVASVRHVPIAPHLLLPQFMDDDDEVQRDMAMVMDHALLEKCDELWLFGDTVSEGMRLELIAAKKLCKKVRLFTDDLKEIGLI